MLKKLVQYGDDRALIIDKSILQAAGIDADKIVFQITVDPTAGIVIQAVEPMKKEIKEESCFEAFKAVIKEHSDLMRRLADR